MTFYERLVEWSNWAWPIVANHLWQATLFSLLILAVVASLRRAPARVRYSLWLVALGKFALPCAALVVLLKGTGVDLTPLFTSGAGAESTSGFALSPFLSPVASDPVFLRVVEPTMTSAGPASATYVAVVQDQGFWYMVLTLFWLAGCALLLGLWLRRRRQLSAAVQAGTSVSRGREWETLERVRSWLGLRRKVALVLSPKVAEPGVWRVFRPVVLLPEGISARLDDSELETVMMHELVHVERRDNLVGAVQRIVCCLLWFHPLVWLLGRRLLAEREQACDDTVIKLSGAREAYASSIRKVCRHSIGWELTALSSAAGSDLKKRLKRIAAPDVNRSPSVMHRLLLCAVTVAVLALSAAVGLIDAGRAESRENDLGVAGIDSRFVVGSPEAGRKSVVARVEGNAPTLPPDDAGLADRVTVSTGLPVVVKGEIEQIRPPEADIIAGAIQPGQEGQPPQHTQSAPSTQSPPNAPAGSLPVQIIPVTAKAQTDSIEFVGRYEVDPSRVENFILDITLEQGELWLKPSHSRKRKLVRTGELGLADVYSDFRFTGIEGSGGRIIALRLDSWDSGITARKLQLPQPSTRGNITFKLRGHANARVVALAGSFNDWNQSKLLFEREGDEWICRLNLAPGRYQYKFIIDGDWITDPSNPKTEDDERGITNSLLIVGR